MTVTVSMDVAVLRRHRTLWPVAVAVAALTGCTASPSLDPVPTKASAPFLCDGVPRRAAELILGGDVEANGTGVWNGDPFRPFQCLITRVGKTDLDEQIIVLPNPVDAIGGDSDENLMTYMGGAEKTTRMTADAPGRGFTSSTESESGAVWVCDGFATRVQVLNTDVEGRDAEADAANLLRSMLPWACGGEDVPAATR